MEKITKMLVKQFKSENELDKFISQLRISQSLQVVDEINDQLNELFFIRNPRKNANNTSQIEIEQFINNLTSKTPVHFFGYWVYFPWKNVLAHYLPEEIHFEIRTARNRNLITFKEQIKYYNSHVGIAGLSVGNSAVGTILHTGGAKYMRLADHDTLANSNLNRIRTSYTNIGLKKTEIAAQEIYEINPYAKLDLYSDGLQMQTLEKFLITPKPLDVLIEEMDNIYLKIQIRLLARKHKIPVIMAADNGDNVVLDIERFDIDSNQPLFHGDVSEDELLSIKPDVSKFEAAKMISRWVHIENVAVKMQGSLMELGKTLYSWPQLGNAAFLAGCVLAYSAKRIILGEEIQSGKYMISIDALLDPNFHTSKERQKRQESTKNLKKMLHL